MVSADLTYVDRLIRTKVLMGPVLELGTGYEGPTCRDLVTDAGLRYFGTDVAPGPRVDFIADFERVDDMAAFGSVAPFGAVLLLNVLEHTFDPIRVLDNARTLLMRRGALVVLTPAVWPLHNFPMDAWRVLPDFYEKYAERRRLKLVKDYFEYVGFGRVDRFRNPDDSYSFPPPCRPGWKLLFGRGIHKAFNTFGRGMFQPSHIAVGAVLADPGEDALLQSGA